MSHVPYRLKLLGVRDGCNSFPQLAFPFVDFYDNVGILLLHFLTAALYDARRKTEIIWALKDIPENAHDALFLLTLKLHLGSKTLPSSSQSIPKCTINGH